MSPVGLHEIPLALPAEEIFAALAARPGIFFLDSEFRSDKSRAVSAVGFEPALTIQWRASTGLVAAPAVDWLPRELHPFEALRRVLALYTLAAGVPGRVHADRTNLGWFGYELGSLLEPKVPSRPDDPHFPDLYWAFHDRAITVDHVERTVRAVATECPLWERLGMRSAPADARARELAERVAAEFPGRLRRSGSRAGLPAVAAPADRPTVPPGDFTRAEYVAAVARAIEYIRAGDIYQVNLSQRFSASLPMPTPDLYRKLRRVNPAPHGGYLAVGPSAAVLSASPELFLRLENGEVLTRPIKGTRPRGKNEPDDARLWTELWDSEKDGAELTMIVDLERNDLGRVCEFGSVRVTEPRRLETHPTVIHLVADVEGRLRSDCDRIDLIRGAFPGGSITGAPKVRSMQIIRELERSPRRVYTGSMGRFGMAGDMELNIAIRTLTAAGDTVHFGAGGGIVADSDPEAEYEETLHKAAGMVRALSGG
jgi:para-aminobenzoate synthetase component 1